MWRSVGRRVLESRDGTMSFAPRFAPDGRKVVFSLESGGNTDIYLMDVATGAEQRLTNAPSIETAPSFSPDGSQIVFESDRSGSQQLYVMSANGGRATADQRRTRAIRHASLVTTGRPCGFYQAI
jgi:TolB protein